MLVAALLTTKSLSAVNLHTWKPALLLLNAEKQNFQVCVDRFYVLKVDLTWQFKPNPAWNYVGQFHQPPTPPPLLSFFVSFLTFLCCTLFERFCLGSCGGLFCLRVTHKSEGESIHARRSGGDLGWFESSEEEKIFSKQPSRLWAAVCLCMCVCVCVYVCVCACAESRWGYSVFHKGIRLVTHRKH